MSRSLCLVSVVELMGCKQSNFINQITSGLIYFGHVNIQSKRKHLNSNIRILIQALESSHAEKHSRLDFVENPFGTDGGSENEFTHLGFYIARITPIIIRIFIRIIKRIIIIGTIRGIDMVNLLIPETLTKVDSLSPAMSTATCCPGYCNSFALEPIGVCPCLH